MPELQSFCLKTDSTLRRATAISQSDLCDDLKVEWKLVGRERVGLGLLGKRWSVRCLFPDQDAHLQLKRGCITFDQHIPAGKVYLAPNPKVKVDKRLHLQNSHSCRVVMEHDMLHRQSRAAAALYHGNDRRTKLAAALHCQKGAEFGLRHKLHRPAIHSVAAFLNPHHGPSLRIKSRPGDGKKTTFTVSPQQHAVQGAVAYKPEAGQTVVKAVADVFLTHPAKSKLLLDVEWRM